MKGGIASRFAIFTSLLVLLATGTVGYMVYRGAEQSLRDASFDRLAHTARIVEVRFRANVEAIGKDVRFLAETPPIQGIVRARFGRGLDRETYINDDEWRDQLAAIFDAFLQSRPSYFQARFVGLAGGGRELVRVEKRAGNVFRAAWSELSQFGDHEDFKAALDIPMGDLYFSEIGLSSEGSELPEPRIPSMRVAAPVYTAQGNLFGLVIVSVDLREVLRGLKELVDSDKSLYMVNSRGNYLLNPDSTKTIGYLRGNQYRLQEDFAEAAEVIAGDPDARTLRLRDVKLEGGASGIAYFERIQPTRGANSQRFVLGVTTSHETFLAGVQVVRNQSALITLLFCLGGIVMALALSGYLTQPLRQITRAVSSFGRDGKAVDLPVRRQDEIGVLARAFDGMAQQIQDQIRQLEDKERRQRTTLETSAEGIIVTDAEGCIENFNKAAERIFGYEAAAVIGEDVGILLSGAGRDEWQAVGTVREVNGRRRDGTQVSLSLAVSTFELAGETMFAGFFQDMTERKEYERALQEAKEDAEAANHAKSAFLANMSHEIRTPLTSIIGFAQLLAKQVSGNQFKFAQLIERSGRRLMETLNAVLALAKLEAGRIEVELNLIDVGEEAREVVQLMEPLAREKHLALHFDLRPEARGCLARLDRGGLSSILLNLVGNAVKFTEQGAIEVRVGVGGLPQRDADSRNGAQPAAARPHVYVSVQDTGVGIEPDFLPHLFDEFRQESTGMSRSHEGSGLGLAITKRLVRLMGGEITVESEKGRGSTFTVWFPVAEQPSAAAHPDLHMPAAEQGDGAPGEPVPARILIVEDNPNSRFLMQTLLEDVSEVTAAASVKEALEAAEGLPFDLVLLDINLEGGGNGADVLRALRERPAYQDVPIVALTAYALPDDRERFLHMGFSNYLSKPFDVDEFLSLTSQLLPR